MIDDFSTVVLKTRRNYSAVILSLVATPFRLAEGIEVPDLSGIHEAWSSGSHPDGHHVFTLNVSAERIRPLFMALAEQVRVPGFLVLEVGAHQAVEEEFRVSDTDPFHNEVHYLDGVDHSMLQTILERYGELWAEDGGIHFGFGSHDGTDEVFVGAYKVFQIYTDQPDKYQRVLEEWGLPRTARLRTVWDNFSEEAPGTRRVLSDRAVTIWDSVVQLTEAGLYFAERRADA